MIKGMEKTNELIFDIDRIKKLLDYIKKEYVNGKYSETQETINTIIQEMESILDQAERKSIIQEVRIPENEEVAQQYFGEDFLRRFEDLRKKLEEQNVSLYIHGTSAESSENILEEGLKYKAPTLNATAVKQSGLEEQEYYQGYSQLLNWPHQNWKNLIMIGVPKECEGSRKEALPLWERIRHAEEGISTNDYRIPSEFIIGEIDVNNKAIIVNPSYTNLHNYTGLIHDSDLTNDNVISSSPNDSELTEEDENQEEPNIDEKNVPIHSLETNIEELTTFLNRILLYKESEYIILDHLKGMLPILSKVAVFDENEVKEIIEDIEKVIPSLKTVKQLQEEQEKKEEERRNRESREGEGEEFEEDWSGEGFEDLDWDEEFETDLDEVIEDTSLSDVNSTTNMLKSNNREQTKEK